MIYLTDFEAGSNADLLANTRLSSIPFNGNLTIQALANLNNATNGYTITIQLPDGEVPVDSQRVSAGQEADALGGQLRSDYLDQWTYTAGQGGHFTISITESGTAVLTWRIVLRR